MSIIQKNKPLAEALEYASHKDLLDALIHIFEHFINEEFPQTPENYSEKFKTIKLYYKGFYEQIQEEYERMGREKEKEIYKKIVAEKNAEIEKIKTQTRDTDPLQMYRNLMEEHAEISGNYQDKIREFRVSYKEKDGVKSVNGFKFAFSNTRDKRCETSAGNGRKGGRPQNPNASERAISRRKENAQT